jgi:RimJ/RimL family protein N-acetyltransferase
MPLFNYSLYALEAPVLTWNLASMRVLEKAALVRDGILRKSIFKYGQLLDCVIYAKVQISSRRQSS